MKIILFILSLLYLLPNPSFSQTAKQAKFQLCRSQVNYLQIPLPNIPETFPKTLSNRRIFLRAIIKGNPKHRIRLIHSELTNKLTPINLTKGRDFLKTLRSRYRYTYVIDDEKLNIAQIASKNAYRRSKKCTDLSKSEAKKRLTMSSKHILLARWSKKVRYAGELWRKKNTLYLDNNSGTYKPNNKLPELADLLQEKWPDIKIKIKPRNVL